MKKFAIWMKENDRTQKGVARKLGISQSSLHEILKTDHVPSLKTALAIEKYTNGAITVYDWYDEKIQEN